MPPDKAAKNNEAGSTSVVGMIAILAATLTTLYVKSSSDTESNGLKVARRSMMMDDARVAHLNNAAIIKSLIKGSPVKSVPGLSEPIVFPSDYFADDWTWQVNELMPGPQVKASANTITFQTLDPKEATLEQLSKYFANASISQVADMKVQRVAEIVNLVPDPNFPIFITAVDVRFVDTIMDLKSKDKLSLSTFARVPMEKPEPRDMKIQILGPGKSDWDENFGTRDNPLMPGTYQFRVIASSVAYYAKINVNGVDTVLGLPKSGKRVTHRAVNVHATAAELGRTQPVMLGGVAPQKTKVTFTKDTCDLDVTNGSDPLNATAADVMVTATVFNIEGKPAVGGDLEIHAYIGPSNAVATDSGAAGGAIACTEKCPTPWSDVLLSTSMADPVKRAHYLSYWDIGLMGGADKTKLDYWSQRETAELVRKGGKGSICENLEIMAHLAYSVNGNRLPSLANDSTFRDWYGQVKGNRAFYAYLAPSCERSFVGTRLGCGCFEESTLILMADGTQNRVDQIRAGDHIRNPKTGRAQQVKRVVAGPEKLPLVAIYTARGVVRVTTEHPFLTTKGLKPALVLKVGDRIVSGERSDTITEVREEIRAEGDVDPNVWNLELEGSDNSNDHYVMANGIMTGDLLIQTRLKENLDLKPYP